MMLSKSYEEEEKKPKPLDAQKKAQEVADLERRLKDLSAAPAAPAATVPSPATQTQPAAKPAPVASGGGGKNALLVRDLLVS